MTQFDRPTLNATVDNGATLTDKFNAALEAIYSSHGGANPPNKPEEGQVWLDNAQITASPKMVTLKIFLGGAWFPIGSLNMDTNIFTTSGGLTINGGPLKDRLLFPSGTVTAPGIAFDGDDNTGIWRSGSDRMDLVTQGTSRLRIEGRLLSTVDFQISKQSPQMQLNKAASGQANAIIGMTNGILRWAIGLGGSTAESGANKGSNFYITRHADDGTNLGAAMNIDRDTGNVSFGGAIVNIAGKSGFNLRQQGQNGRILDFEPNTYIWKHQDNADLEIIVGNGGRLNINAQGGLNVWARGQGFWFHQNSWDGASWHCAAYTVNPNWDWMSCSSFHTPGVVAGLTLNVGPHVPYQFRQDGWAVSVSGWGTYSDSRVKKDVRPITGALDSIMKIVGCTFLRTDVEPLYNNARLQKVNRQRRADNLPEVTNPPERRRAGFIAQEVEAVLPEAVGEDPEAPTGYTLQQGGGKRALDTTAVLALAVQAIKELKSQVDDLKSQVAALKGTTP